MKFLLSILTTTLIINQSISQDHKVLESPNSDALTLNSTGSDGTVINFFNANAAPTEGSGKRAYISTNVNVLNLRLSNNNTEEE